MIMSGADGMFANLTSLRQFLLPPNHSTCKVSVCESNELYGTFAVSVPLEEIAAIEADEGVKRFNRAVVDRGSYDGCDC